MSLGIVLIRAELIEIGVGTELGAANYPEGSG